MNAQERHVQAVVALEASLNSIFLHIGATFSSPSCFEPANIPRTRSQLQQALPKGRSAFQAALDTLEYDIKRARSVLHRDMAAVENRRPKQEPTHNRDELETGGQQQHDIGGVSPAWAEYRRASGEIMPETAKEVSPEAMIVGPPVESSRTVLDAPADPAGAPNGEPAPNQHLADSKLRPEQPVNAPEQVVTLPSPPPPPPSSGGRDTTGSAGATAMNRISGSINTPDNEFDDLFMQDDSMSAGQMRLDTSVEQPDAEVNSLLPGLEFYANDNSATSGALDGFGDLTGSALESGVHFADTNDSMGTGGMLLEGGHEGRNAMADTNFDDWLASVDAQGRQGGEAQTNMDDAQFDASFFNLD